MSHELFQPLTEEELEELDRFLLEECDSDDAILDVSELDGFFTAIISGPDAVMPSEWLPVIYGDDEGPDWKSEAQMEHILKLMVRLMNCNAYVLMETPEDYEALFYERERDGKVYQVVDEWCHGFLKGVSLRLEQWKTMPNLMDDYLAPIGLFAIEEGWEQLESMGEAEIQFFQEQIIPNVRKIHAYWLNQRAEEYTDKYTNTGSTIYARSSDNLCICGSGRQFVECCGQARTLH